ncbi:MAG: hypothetical protein SO018_01730 [Ligilactobacillus saerimneri]|nr:hypothetical protein [Ligilactobacillus saerimneri]
MTDTLITLGPNLNTVWVAPLTREHQHALVGVWSSHPKATAVTDAQGF